DALTRLLNDKSGEVRWKASYALMQIAHGLDSKSLIRAAQDEEAQVRMFAVQALGKLQNTAYLETLGNLLRRDRDWRVRVNSANALGNYPLRLAANYLTLLDTNHHVRIAVIHALGRCALNEADEAGHNTREFNLVKSQLQEVLTAEEETESWTLPEKGAALVAYAQVMKPGAIDLISQFVKHPNKKLRARAMEALGETHSRKAFHILQNAYAQAPMVVKVAILEALSKIDDPRKPQLYARALEEGDMVLTALSAEALSQDALRNAIQLPRIIDAFGKLPKPVDIESAQMIFEALAKFRDPRAVPILETALRTPDRVYSKAAAKALHEITGEDYTSQIATFTQPHDDFSYKEIRRLKSAKAFIKTKRGTIQFELLTDEAPLTVLNFVRLARQGFFDGLTFHRVVPNFVIQGGDPRGDSWGSPGYSIRSEFNKHPYLRGTVGMASAGKDTEGCQFFITHSPQPHLDGRYTVFGQVTAGLEVVDAIEEGDVMELVAVKR
ncbi:MAG: peptidylprolyl isomerase, partial [bacterium]